LLLVLGFAGSKAKACALRTMQKLKNNVLKDKFFIIHKF
jgi:hypothetical protein